MADNSSGQTQKADEAKNALLSHLRTDEVVVVAVMVLSMIGVGITDFSPGVSHWFWVIMVPVFGVACTFLGWTQKEHGGPNWTILMRNQIVLWVGLLVAVQLVYLLLHAGRLDNENTGLIILLLLALTVFTSGIQLGWRLCVVGFLLAVALVMATYLEEFTWLFVLLTAVVIAGIYLASKFNMIPR